MMLGTNSLELRVAGISKSKTRHSRLSASRVIHLWEHSPIELTPIQRSPITTRGLGLRLPGIIGTFTTCSSPLRQCAYAFGTTWKKPGLILRRPMGRYRSGLLVGEGVSRNDRPYR